MNDEPTPDEVRESMAEEIRDGDGEAVYLGVTEDDQFASLVVSDADGREDAASMVENADAALSAIVVDGDKAQGGMFSDASGEEKQQMFRDLLDEIHEDTHERADGIEPRPEVTDHTPEVRAVFAAHTRVVSEQNPIVGLLADLGDAL